VRDYPEYEEWNKFVEITMNTDNHDYELHFQKCRYHESNIVKDKYKIEFLNWRFKNSAILKNILKHTKKDIITLEYYLLQVVSMLYLINFQ